MKFDCNKGAIYKLQFINCNKKTTISSNNIAIKYCIFLYLETKSLINRKIQCYLKTDQKNKNHKIINIQKYFHTETLKLLNFIKKTF